MAQEEPPEAGTEVVPLTPLQVDRLFLLAKVWGFLKYHHPLVTAGCFDWDAQLLAQAESLRDAEEEPTELISQWISSLSDEECIEGPAADVHYRADIGWLEDHRLLGFELGNQLRSLETSSAGEDPQHYLTLAANARNPQFRNEKGYGEVQSIDWGYRFLALARYWNIVEYWFPYRNLISADWDAVLQEFIVRFYDADDRRRYQLELMAMIARTEDGHANLWSAIGERPPGGTAKPPFVLRIVEGKVFVGRRLALVEGAEISYAPDECLRYGDLLLEVDETPVAELMTAWAPYYGASNAISRDDAMVKHLLQGDDDIVSVVVERNGEQFSVECLTLPLDRIVSGDGASHDRDGVTLQLLSQDIAYLKLSTFDEAKVDNYLAAADGTRGMIIDIRGYPASFAVFTLGQHLVSEPTPFARFTTGDLTQPGTFHWTKPLSLSPAKPTYDGRIIILVDEKSFSQAEYTAMAFRAVPDAVVVGSRTAGADGNVSQIPLPGGYSTAISGIGVFYPDKTPTQKVGIVPDIEVRPTIDGLREHRDEVLEAAIREILGDEAGEAQVRAMASQRQD